MIFHRVYSPIFLITDPLFQILQKKDLDAIFCKAQVELAIGRIKGLRNDEKFQKLLSEANSTAKRTKQRAIDSKS